MSEAAGWWAEVDALPTEAERIDPAARAAFLDARCAGRPRLHEEVEAQLLAKGAGLGYRRIAEVLGDPGERNLGDGEGALRQVTTAGALLEPEMDRPDVPVTSPAGPGAAQPARPGRRCRI